MSEAPAPPGLGPLFRGRIVDRYEVLGPIGRGEVADVVLVRHRSLGTLAALKRLALASPGQAARLVQDARSQAALVHENLVQIDDVVDVDGVPALVVEYVSGPTLDRLLAERRPSLAQAQALGEGILAGMAEAHRCGLVHGDLKPRSVILELTEQGPVPKVGDLGLAEVVTVEGPLVGLPAYRSPQVRAGAEPDRRADVYSLGALLYELVTGERPALEEPVPLAHRVPQLPAPLGAVIEQSLSDDPRARPADAGELLRRWRAVPRPLAHWPGLDTLRPPLGDQGWDADAGQDPPTVEVLVPAPSPARARRFVPLALGLALLLLLAGLLALLLR